jgi:tetratricopeptide (TPR) repeat protein
MPESKRLESPLASEVADRDSRVEALLLEGLDRYFAGQYEDAVHVWTRVLFLDRSHARARAYIDRARTALAERQRRADEMLAATNELLAQGQTEQARALLSEAEAASGDDQHTAALRAKLDRVERARMQAGRRPLGPAVTDAQSVRQHHRWSVTRAVLGALGLAATGAVVAAGTLVLQGWFARSAQPLPALARMSPLPVLSSTDVALVRARTLYARGRLAEALLALDQVEMQDTRRSEADKLRVEIQQILLATRRRGAALDGEDRGSR